MRQWRSIHKVAEIIGLELLYVQRIDRYQIYLDNISNYLHESTVIIIFTKFIISTHLKISIRHLPSTKQNPMRNRWNLTRTIKISINNR